MTETIHALPERRARRREEWKGLSAAALFDALEAEPVVGDALCGVGDALRERMAGRTLHLVALRVAVARNSLYTWRGHCHIALGLGDAGLSEDEIARTAVRAHGLEGADSRVLDVVDELLRTGAVRPQTRAALSEADALSVIVATLFYATITVVLQGAEPEAPATRGLETPAIAARRAGGRG